MAHRRWGLIAVALTLATAVGCGGPGRSKAPPDLAVQASGAPVTLQPWSYCWGSGCADGAPRKPLPSVGTGDRVTVSVAEVGLRFTAEFTASGDRCARVQRVALGTAATAFPIWPAGPAGTYEVTLHADGGQGRSASYAFRWTTTRNGAWPTPAASAAVLADHDGTIDTYGVNIGIENLARSPRRASASLEITSAEGRRTTMRLRWVRPSEGCEPTGSAQFEGPELEAQQAARSGSPPFRYDLALVLDGRTYRGTATWPDDQIADAQPYVSLRFRPALPALPR